MIWQGADDADSTDGADGADWLTFATPTHAPFKCCELVVSRIPYSCYDVEHDMRTSAPDVTDSNTTNNDSFEDRHQHVWSESFASIQRSNYKGPDYDYSPAGNSNSSAGWLSSQYWHARTRNIIANETAFLSWNIYNIETYTFTFA